jgi:hypothetical protein
MAKTSGVLKIEGTIDDLTFYKKDGKFLVRKKGGISKERIANDPNFVRTRENGSEFGHSGKSGKLLRLALGSMVYKAKDNKLSSRMLQLMSQIKNYDVNSARGERKVGLGLTTVEGKQLLKGFDFNNNARLKNVLFTPFELDTSSGKIKINNLLPIEQLQFPQGSTHVSFQSAVLAIDFLTEVSEVAFSPIENLAIDRTISTPVLIPTSVPIGSGVQLFLLMISFYQEVNGVQYSLKNEEYNVLNVIEVV